MRLLLRRAGLPRRQPPRAREDPRHAGRAATACAAARSRRPTTSCCPTRAGSSTCPPSGCSRARTRRPRAGSGPAWRSSSTGRTAILRQAYSQSTDDPRIQIPDPRFTGPVATSAFYAAYVALPRRRATARATAGRWRSRACSRCRSCCASGASSRGCPSSTTPTRTRTSCPRRSGSSGTPTTRTTSSTRRPTRTCCTWSSPCGSAGRDGVSHAYATDPTSVFVVARVTAGLLGTLAVWLVYLAGARLFDRRVGLLAAALLGGRVPAGLLLAPRAQRRAGAGARGALAARHRRGAAPRAPAATTRSRASGSGSPARRSTRRASCALPLLAAAVIRFADDAAARRRVVIGVALVGATALAAFLIANPYALLRPRRLPRGPDQAVLGGRRRGERQARALAVQRRPLLPVDPDLGPGLGAGAGGARRRGVARAHRLAAGGSCSCPRRCSSSCSWAARTASSGAGCCRSSRSSACSRPTRRVTAAGAVARRRPQLARGALVAALPGAARAGARSTPCTPTACSPATTRAA